MHAWYRALLILPRFEGPQEKCSNLFQIFRTTQASISAHICAIGKLVSFPFQRYHICPLRRKLATTLDKISHRGLDFRHSTARFFFFFLVLRKKPYMSAKLAIAAISADS